MAPPSDLLERMERWKREFSSATFQLPWIKIEIGILRAKSFSRGQRYLEWNGETRDAHNYITGVFVLVG